MIKTKAGEKMKEKNPNKDLPEKADINNDGEFQEWEKARHEAIQAARSEDSPEMAMGGLMREGMGVIIGIEADSGNTIPAGSLPEEVADDIPAMLSEGEYVVPADVVRWHGVKTFEELRCEAKMGMGLMAHDGRIAEVDEETKKPVESHDVKDNCPLATQNLKVNTENRDSAIQAEHIQYGPLNIDEPGTFWKNIAEFWDTSVNAAQKSQCGNCTAFDISPRMRECMPGQTSDDDGVLGYCWMHKFKCHSARSCRTWAKGGPIEENKISLNWQSRSDKSHGDDSSVEYDIEEKDKPEVERPEVQVVEAAEGALVTPEAPFYRYESRLNPATNRYEFVPVDATTGETVTQETFNQAQSTRYTPQTVLGLDSEEDIPDCPDGFEYDEEVGACMPIDRSLPRSVTSPDTGGDGAPDVTGEQVQGLAGLPSYQLAEAIGPNTEFAGKPVDALTRATTPTEPAVTGFLSNTLIGAAINEGSRMYDSVGAHRAVLQRTEDIRDTASGLDATALPQTYNLNFDPETASYTATTSSQITELQERDGGGTWATDFDHVGASGQSYTSEETFNSDEAAFDVIDGIEAELDATTAVTGGPQLDTGRDDDDGDRGGGFDFGGDDDTSVSTGGDDSFDTMTFDDVADDPDWSGGDDGDDGDDGGRYCCSRMVHHELWTVEREFARLSAWSRKQPDWWRSGYNVWGKVVAKHLLGKQGFWTEVMQAFYDHHVMKKSHTFKSRLADLVIYPGAFICGHIWKHIPEQTRLSRPEEFI